MSQENVDFVLDAYARFNAGERTPEPVVLAPGRGVSDGA